MQKYHRLRCLLFSFLLLAIILRYGCLT
ncbi:hypothetical protein QQP08_023023 [Theobroma cacao]|nr:hypothetical protein QQP08_023023 [Theobroma cacao]